MNAFVPPTATEAVDGATAIDRRAADVTVKRVFPLTEPTVALIDDVPVVRVDARPLLLTLATVGAEDAQVTPDDSACVVPSE